MIVVFVDTGRTVRTIDPDDASVTSAAYTCPIGAFDDAVKATRSDPGVVPCWTAVTTGAASWPLATSTLTTPVDVALFASVAVIVWAARALTTVGLPVTTPVVALSASPAGSGGVIA